MAKKYDKVLFIFRRDLRLQDNTALNAAAQASKTVLPCFIFDPRQCSSENSFLSSNALQFMIESLQDLEKQIIDKGGRLYFFHGIAEDVVEQVIKAEKIDALFFNQDYTPFSLRRDEALQKLCSKYGIDCQPYHDVLLHQPEKVKKQDGTPYSLFTAFYKRANRFDVAQPQKIRKFNFSTRTVKDTINEKEMYKKLVKQQNEYSAVRGGTAEALRILRHLEKFENYVRERDIPSISTTYLSAHLKFGTVSIRQTYYTIQNQLGGDHLLLQQLYWRDFYTYIAYHSPFVFGAPYYTKYESLPWSKNKRHFAAWCKGRTGFPVVDAGMRQLNQAGYMHNRVRMIVATFLVKDLHVNWLWGEKYFAQKLIDYDPAVNNGNWQWCASTGASAQPYFRIFNPWRQQKKFDPDCVYVKTWVPELKEVDAKVLHAWYKDSAPEIPGYPRPLVDHKAESAKSKSMYKAVR